VDEHEFIAATRVEPRGPERFAAQLSGRWAGPHQTANGGYSVSVALTAAQRIAGLPDPLAAAASFPTRAAPGPVELECRRVGQGRRTAIVETTMRQADRVVLKVLSTFGDLGHGRGRDGPTMPPPDLPPPASCVDLAPAEVLPHVPIAAQFDYRVAQWPGWRRGEPSGSPALEFWLRARDGAPLDGAGLATVADAGERAVFEIGEFASLTLQLTLYVRARAAPGWLGCRVVTRHVAAGYYEEDCAIWDSQGQLVGQSRQLAVLLH
jgi:hypothetical protein